MGGEKNRFEPTTYDKWQKNKEVWEEFFDGGMVPFLERLHGHSSIVMERFVKGLNKGVLTAFGAEFQVDETLVVIVIGLNMKCRKLYRDGKSGEDVIASFYDKEKE